MRLIDMASVIRSKNAGPYELTLDIVFKSKASFNYAVRNGFPSAALVSRLYGVPQRDILHIVNFEIANAVKITLRRPIVSGAIGETDVYGAQQHAPLLDVVLAEAASD